MLRLDPVWQADIQQAQFRLLLEAMSRPGRCYPLSSIPETGNVALAVLAVLLDAEVSLADPHKFLCNDDWPMLQAKRSATDQADYILCDAGQVEDFVPKLGTLANPEQSATLVFLVDELADGETNQGEMKLTLTGSGVATGQCLAVSGLRPEWLSMREDWNSAFPLGVDFILVDGIRIAALPRTTNVEVM